MSDVQSSPPLPPPRFNLQPAAPSFMMPPQGGPPAAPPPAPSGISRWVLAFGSLGVIAAVLLLLGILQFVIPDEYQRFRPSTIYGDITGEMVAAEMQAQARAAAAFTEGKKEGELNAQIRFEAQLAQVKLAAEQQLVAYKATVELTNKYFETLYGALGKSVETGLAMERELSRQRTLLTTQTQSWSRMAASVLDGLGTAGLLMGNPELAAYGDEAEKLRRRMEQQIGDAAASGTGDQYDLLMSQVPNVDQLRANQERWLIERGVQP